MGDERARTPALDALAERGVVFERAYASVPLTLPSHATMLTGLDPVEHGLRDNGRFPLPDSIETVAERLRARGYATGAFVAALVLDESFGLAQGFDTYDDELPPKLDPLDTAVPSRRGAEVTDRAIAWLERTRGPRFAWVHYYDVHWPRDPPPPFDALGDAYAGELAYVDAQVGRLLEAVEARAGGRETLVLVVGDHGEGLGDHQEASHGMLAYDSTLHVPLLAVGTGFAAGARSRAFVRTLDVAPTLLAAAGAPTHSGPARGRGIPLQQRLEATGEGEVVDFFETLHPSYGLGWSPVAGVRTSRWKYTASPEPVELYDVVADPAETANRAEQSREIASRMRRLFDSQRSASDDLDATPSAAIPEPLREQLFALGYVDARGVFEPDARPDPRQVVGTLGLLHRAQRLALEGRVADSIRALEILASSPVVRVLALQRLAALYMAAERFADGVEAHRRLAALTESHDAILALAAALLVADRPAEALAELDAVEARGGASSELWPLLRGQALVALGRFEEAERIAEAVRAANPDSDSALALASRARAAHLGAPAEIERLQAALRKTPGQARPETRLVLAELLRAERRDREAVRTLEALEAPLPEHRILLARIARDHGNRAKAASLLESAHAQRPADGALRWALAELYGELGRLREARALYDALVEVDPADPALLVNRGALALRQNDHPAARADLERALTLDAGSSEAAFNLALLATAEGREKDAEQRLLQVVALRPEHAKAHLHLARIYQRRGDARAAHHAEQAARWSSEDALQPPDRP